MCREVCSCAYREVAEKLPWAEEVLVSKGDLDERSQHVAELEAQARPHQVVQMAVVMQT